MALPWNGLILEALLLRSMIAQRHFTFVEEPSQLVGLNQHAHMEHWRSVVTSQRW